MSFFGHNDRCRLSDGGNGVWVSPRGDNRGISSYESKIRHHQERQLGGAISVFGITDARGYGGKTQAHFGWFLPAGREWEVAGRRPLQFIEIKFAARGRGDFERASVNLFQQRPS